jgi:hypothetical protein
MERAKQVPVIDKKGAGSSSAPLLFLVSAISFELKAIS